MLLRRTWSNALASSMALTMDGQKDPAAKELMEKVKAGSGRCG